MQQPDDLTIINGVVDRIAVLQGLRVMLDADLVSEE
jgi:hypothetical protein